VQFKCAEYSDALRVLEHAARSAPQSSEIRFHLGMTEAQLGRNDRARSDLEAAVSGSSKASWSDQARSVLASLKDRSG
jgi:Flp pilus assembly protein TadD